MPDPTPESHWPSGVQAVVHVPDVVEWKPLCHTQCSVLPTRIVVVLFPLCASLKTFPPFAPTLTVAVAGCGTGVAVGFAGGGVIVGVGLPGTGVAVGPPGCGVDVGAGTGPGFVTVLLSLQRQPARIASASAAERKTFRPMSYLLKGTSRQFVIDASSTRDVVARQVPRGEIESVFLGNV